MVLIIVFSSPSEIKSADLGLRQTFLQDEEKKALGVTA